MNNQAGKGSKRRSKDNKYCSDNKFRDNWDKIFNKKEKEKNKDNEKNN